MNHHRRRRCRVSTYELSAAWPHITGGGKERKGEKRHWVINYSERVRMVTNILLINISAEKFAYHGCMYHARVESPEHCIIVYCTYHSSVICVKRKRGIKRLSAKEGIMDVELHREFNARNLFNSISACARTRTKLRAGASAPFGYSRRRLARHCATHFFSQCAMRDRRRGAMISRRNLAERDDIIKLEKSCRARKEPRDTYIRTHAHLRARVSKLFIVARTIELTRVPNG